MTFTLVTAPKGPNICQRILSSASGAKLYTKMHHPVPACPGILIPAKLVIPSMVIGGNLLKNEEKQNRVIIELFTKNPSKKKMSKLKKRMIQSFRAFHRMNMLLRLER